MLNRGRDVTNCSGTKCIIKPVATLPTGKPSGAEHACGCSLSTSVPSLSHPLTLALLLPEWLGPTYSDDLGSGPHLVPEDTSGFQSMVSTTNGDRSVAWVWLKTTRAMLCAIRSMQSLTLACEPHLTLLPHTVYCHVLVCRSFLPTWNTLNACLPLDVWEEMHRLIELQHSLLRG